MSKQIGNENAMTLEAALRAAADDRLWAADYVQGTLAVDLWGDREAVAVRPLLRDPLPVAKRLAQGVVEVLTGIRGPAQLVRWTTPEVHAMIARLGGQARRRGVSATPSAVGRMHVRRVVCCEPCFGVAEVSVVVSDERRVRAFAMRMVGFDGDWRIEEFELG